MMRVRFLSLFRQPVCRTPRGKKCVQQRTRLSFIETPVDDHDGCPPHLYRHSDATPIELFLDLFFVASLSTFTATHEIYNLEALTTYIGFLGMIWFTWLQVTLFDIRFARDSIFERICKAIQLAAMVGFASAGTRFSTRVRDENVWVFQSLSIFLFGSRALLATQYAVNIAFVRDRMRPAAKGLSIIATSLFASSLVYLGMFFVFNRFSTTRSYIWTIWFALFALEMWIIMGVSCHYPEIGLKDTHLNIRMGLLTLIIIGEGVIAVTRIVNKTVRPVGWTKWSFVHILGATTNVYFVWQSYYDLSPTGILETYIQQLWAQLHFPFHVALILLLEGSQILALNLDITLKLSYLTDVIMFACAEPRPPPVEAIDLLWSTIDDMEINYSHGAIKEQMAIAEIFEVLPNDPLCPTAGSGNYSATNDRLRDLVGNVTAALFTSMGLVPPGRTNFSQMDGSQLLRTYVGLLGFVYQYFFVVASIVMFLFAAFVFLAGRHDSHASLVVGMGVRILFGVMLACLASFASFDDFTLAYSFMTSPLILYAFTLILLMVLLVDRLLDYFAAQNEARVRRTQESEATAMSSIASVAIDRPPSCTISMGDVPETLYGPEQRYRGDFNDDTTSRIDRVGPK